VLIQARDSKSGVGISGMRGRVEELGGCLTIDCNGEGTTVLVTIPVAMGFHD
jgi:signal transduction histidine kinase